MSVKSASGVTEPSAGGLMLPYLKLLEVKGVTVFSSVDSFVYFKTKDNVLCR